MAARLPPGNQRHDGEYEDLLSLWSDLESALSVVLSAPLRVQDFPAKVRQIDRWLQDLVAHDIDAALYLMFQLASTSSVGYSASHALVCGTLCHIMAQELQLPPRERDSLVRAALTMNIAMTALQDVLAGQREKPTAAQQDAIRNHPRRARHCSNACSSPTTSGWTWWASTTPAFPTACRWPARSRTTGSPASWAPSTATPP